MRDRRRVRHFILFSRLIVTVLSLLSYSPSVAIATAPSGREPYHKIIFRCLFYDFAHQHSLFKTPPLWRDFRNTKSFWAKGVLSYNIYIRKDVGKIISQSI